ncbi:shikimate kinase [Flagellimonas myxillae]|uniref:shikimate kinase n=1 Tax=Flagellimonas myxillae TaxID=2942214 RepID=UPI00201EA31B|nr:shikimate kinase [Muricauda myxillae]MCL6267869.1 AAA family ATPase [Muricauda myxillae]
MKVVLVGYMASGKSSVGKQLAQELGLEFVDLDEYIEAQQQKSIKEIFKDKGEIFFRKLEHKMLLKILTEKETLLLSTGGGTPCYSNNMDTILEHSDQSIYLQLPVSALVERIKGEKDQRPLVRDLKDGELAEFVGKHLFERRPFYSKSKFILDCYNKSIAELVEEVKQELL